MICNQRNTKMPSVRKRSGEGVQTGAWSHFVATNGKAVTSSGLSGAASYHRHTLMETRVCSASRSPPASEHHWRTAFTCGPRSNIIEAPRAVAAVEANRPGLGSHHYLGDVQWWASHFPPGSITVTARWGWECPPTGDVRCGFENDHRHLARYQILGNT